MSGSTSARFSPGCAVSLADADADACAPKALRKRGATKPDRPRSAGTTHTTGPEAGAEPGGDADELVGLAYLPTRLPRRYARSAQALGSAAKAHVVQAPSRAATGRT